MFDLFTKFAMIVCNKDYNERYVTLGDLPTVEDDFKVAKHTAMMMGIPPENRFEMKEANYKELDQIFAWLQKRFTVLARKLDKVTGLLGSDGFTGGVLWQILKEHAMKLTIPFDKILIELNQKD